MNQTIILLAGLLLLALNCNAISGGKEDDKTTMLAIAAYVSSSNTNAKTTNSISCSSSTTGTTVTASTATLDASTGCVNGVTTCMDSALPDWIKNNFKCAVGYVSGTNYVFKSQNIPNTKSYYYTAYSTTSAQANLPHTTTYPLYESLPSGYSSAGTNVIASQNLVYTIPATPARGTGAVSTGGGLASAGITLNGLAIYNNAAAPPDVLASEATTFDNYGGHPENTGVYHHHAQVPKVCDNTTSAGNSASCNNSALIGIALDGFAIYGQKCDNGTSSTSDDFTPTLDNLHGHTAVTQHFSTATYHYHYAYDSTATIYTILGSFFYGSAGSVTK